MSREEGTEASVGVESSLQNRLARQGLPEKVAFEERSEGSEGSSDATGEGRGSVMAEGLN